jgi:uncharacterized repeat protein (TIGR04042 family)
MRFNIRWPDGAVESCYSPSLVIKDYFTPGTSYRLAEFLERSHTALTIASDRVRAKYGKPCARALAQRSRIEDVARTFANHPHPEVSIISFEE